MSDQQKWPQVDVVLFNTHSSDDVTAKDRQDCMETVLDDILEQSGPDVFVLCQNNITRPKHNILCRKMRMEAAARPGPKQEADVYYRCLPDDTRTEKYHVTYLDSKQLAKANEAVTKYYGHNSDFSISRLTVCKLTIPRDHPHYDDGGKNLLVASWHGPVKGGLEAKMACYKSMFRVLQHLKGEEKCCAFIVGGNFNMEAEAVEEYERRGAGRSVPTWVWKYAPTEGGESVNKSGLVVAWPLYDLKLGGDERLLCPEFRRTPPHRPFDHNVLLFRFGEPALIQQSDAKKNARA